MSVQIENILVSLIIPVYNCEKYLDRALKSAQNQSHRNIQIIVIDDGSTDDTSRICERFQKADPRFLIIHKDNGGVSSARNVGIKNAKGDYILFMDGDDVIRKDYIEIMLINAVKYDVYIVTCNEIICNKGVEEKVQISKTGPFYIEVNNYDFMEAWSHATVWGVLFHKSILTGLEFDTSICVGEDSLFFSQALIRCDRIIHVPVGLYYYYVYDFSALHGSYNEKKLTEIYAWQKISNNMRVVSPSLHNSSRARLVRHAVSGYKRMCIECEADKAMVSSIILKAIRDNIEIYIQSSASLKSKANALAIMAFPNLYFLCYRLLKHYK